MDRDNEIELIETIQEKDKRIKELEEKAENVVILNYQLMREVK